MMATPRAWFTAGAVMALAGCTTPQSDPEPWRPVEHTREVLVQTIPRRAYVSRNHEYIGVAPIAVEIKTDSRGHPRAPVQIRATDTPTGSYVTEVLNPLNPVPEKMLIEIRSYLPKPDPVTP